MIRPARPEDIPEIHELICELADYEMEPGAVRATPTDLERALFGDNPQVFCHVAETPRGGHQHGARRGEHVSPTDNAAKDNAAGTGPALDGFALWFISYSTWEGVHGIHLEDIFVRENRRGRGIGGDLLRALARVAHERGYARIEWSALKWNKPAIGFYEHIGAEVQDDWDTYRLTGHELKAFARSADAAF